ncbi:hypothetical protein PNEG_00382 [Pneumocystis murina B123]|uniref:Uncharacterized protein n=1 Tax=Pneumocystis murina (strain B123) TaxID=1069680 RepID=M7PLM8_PNEMU|nr:hypothetical protein PNEG_00382 [Pneumocystis murina B123]EMR11354.1 hypothetical protein PNEG_00382 [Pneumocystis murina B123]
MKWIEYSFICLIIFSNCIFSMDLERHIFYRGSEFRPRNHLIYKSLKKDFYNEISEEYLLESSSSEWNSLKGCQDMIVCKVHVEGTEVVVLRVIGKESLDDTHIENTSENSGEKEFTEFPTMEDFNSDETQEGNLIDHFIDNCEECEECQECGECEGYEGCDDNEFYIEESNSLSNNI